MALGEILTSGCSMLKNVPEIIVGDYMGSLEKARQKGQSKIFDCKIDDCFDRILVILSQMQADILKTDIFGYKIMAVVSRKPLSKVENENNVNTADVGIFLSQTSDGKTKVEVSSLSSIFVNYVAETIFSKLEFEGKR